MTLILTLGNSAQVIQISDRRLTSKGKSIDDEANKAIILSCANARFAVGFSGLARWREFRTRDWLIDAINDSGPPSYEAKGILERLQKRASEDFLKNPYLTSLPQAQKRLSILFSGYLYHHTPPLMAYSILTNYQNFETGKDEKEAWPQFRLSRWREKRPLDTEPTLIQGIGNWPTLEANDDLLLRTLLEEKKPKSALLGKAVEVMRNIADQPLVKGTIGKQLSSIIIPSDLNKAASSGYYSNQNTWKTYMPDFIVLKEGGSVSFKGLEIGSVDKEKSPPVAVRKVGRNKPCPCGSGKKYKYCHGR